MTRYKDLTGQRFGRLVVLEPIKEKGQNLRWKCQCDCGNIHTVLPVHLKSGNTKSCGCLKRELGKKRATKHGQYKNRIYSCWHGMIGRCTRTNDKDYKNYGGRGISVYEEWKKDFQSFYDWAMANGYAENLTLDRIDVNGNYEPANCRWITRKEQARNRRSNVLITYNNKTMTVVAWAEEFDISVDTLRYRLWKGWTIKNALTQPPKHGPHGNMTLP